MRHGNGGGPRLVFHAPHSVQTPAHLSHAAPHRCALVAFVDRVVCMSGARQETSLQPLLTCVTFYCRHTQGCGQRPLRPRAAGSASAFRLSWRCRTTPSRLNNKQRRRQFPDMTASDAKAPVSGVLPWLARHALPCEPKNHGIGGPLATG